MNRRQMLKVVAAGAAATVPLATTVEGKEKEAANSFEIVWGNNLQHINDYYYLDCNYQHRNERAYACDPNCTLIIPEDKLDYAHWRFRCLNLPNRPRRWKIRIKVKWSDVEEAQSGTTQQENIVYLVKWNKKNENFKFADEKEDEE